MLSLSEILTHFAPAKRIGKDYRTLCPAHADSPAHPSLCIRDGDLAIVFKCESRGCAVADIIGNASPPLVWSDVLPDTNGNGAGPSPQVVYTAAFHDEEGVLLYKSIRYHPKAFKMQAANGSWSVAGIRRVLYRLPELVNQRVIWYVEGPQKADALWRLGIPATCHVGGAGGWNPWASEYLTQWARLNADIVGCPDRDSAGEDMIAAVVRAVHGLGRRAKVVQLPGLSPKGDILDWLRAGGTKAELEQLRQDTPLWTPAVDINTDHFERVGLNTYRWVLPQGIRFEFDYVRREHHELHGELGVYTTIPSARVIDGDVLHVASFNASSLPAREKLATSLAKRAGTKTEDVDWVGLLERFCRRVADAERQSVQVIDLADIEPAADGEDATWNIDGLPILKHHPVLLYGDGGTAKSHLLLRIAGRLAFEGLRVLYADWEFEPGDHRLRLGRLFGAHLPRLTYMRLRAPIFECARQIARVVSERKIDFLICDSIGAAADAPGLSLNDSTTANLYYNTVASIAPDRGSMHSAHVSRQMLEQSRGDIPQKPFGSAFWSYRARSSWYVKKQDDSRNPLHLAFHHTKASTSALQESFGLNVEFQATTTDITPWTLPPDAGRPRGRMLLVDRMADAVAHQALTPWEVAKRIGHAKPDSIRRMFERDPRFRRVVGADGVDTFGLATDESFG